MAFDVATVNRALIRLGVSEMLTSSDEVGDSTVARVANALWDTTRDLALKAHDWPFARKWAELIQPSGVTIPEKYDRAYLLPEDCLKPRAIEDGRLTRSIEEDVHYRLGAWNDRTVMFCNEDAVTLIYTARVENTAAWTPEFVDVLAWWLASDMALGVGANLQYAANASAKLPMALYAAKGDALNSEPATPQPKSRILAARA